jgi:hypothetical protein
MSNLKEAITGRFGMGQVEREILGQKVYIRKLCGDAVETFQFSRIDKRSKEVDYNKLPGMKAELVHMCLCDEVGAALFESPNEVKTTLTYEFIEAAFSECQEVNGMNAGAAAKAEKNS